MNLLRLSALCLMMDLKITHDTQKHAATITDLGITTLAPVTLLAPKIKAQAMAKLNALMKIPRRLILSVLRISSSQSTRFRLLWIMI